MPQNSDFTEASLAPDSDPATFDFVAAYTAKRGVFRAAIIVLIVVLTWLVLDQFFGQFLPANMLASYVGLSLISAFFVLERLIAHPVNSGALRLEDPSEVEAFLIEADTVEPRLPVSGLDDEKLRPTNYKQKLGDLAREVSRLRSLGSKKWSEYRVLPLKQMLIEFYKVDDLRAQAQSLLSELEEYAGDSSYRYDMEYYGKWKERIDQADRLIVIKEEQDCTDLARDDAAERLRAEVRTIRDHIADYQQNWAMGSVLVRGLQANCAVAVPILIVMALLPLFHPAGAGFLRVFDWGLLGAAGSVTAVMLALRTTDLVEVGNTQGKKEIWRAILGAVLGLVAGIMAFGIIGGGLISGAAVPTVHSSEVMDIALTLVWGIGAGVSLERVFDRVRQITDSM